MKRLFAAIGCVVLSALFISTVRAADALKPDSKGFIRDWVMLAPVPLPLGSSGAELIVEDQIKNEGALQPKAGDTITIHGKEMTWRNITATTNYVDFNALLKRVNDHVAGYLVTYVECDREMPGVTMAVGSNDEGRIYLNGTDIYAYTEPRMLEIDSEKGKVHLHKGVNVIVFKIINEQNSWQGAMRFLDASGAPLTDLKIRLTP